MGSGEGYAGGGGFEVPQVDGHFDQVKPGPAPKKTEPMTQNAKEEGGTWDWITKPVSGAWEWTKETASSLWDWFIGILAKITEVVVDALSAAWDWIVKYKEYVAFAGVLILGIVLFCRSAARGFRPERSCLVVCHQCRPEWRKNR